MACKLPPYLRYTHGRGMAGQVASSMGVLSVAIQVLNSVQCIQQANPSARRSVQLEWNTVERQQREAITQGRHRQAGMVHSANQQAKAVMAVLDPCSRVEYMSAISLTLNLVLWQSDGPEVKEYASYSLFTSVADVVDPRFKPCDLCLEQLLDPSNLGICILLILLPLFIIARPLQAVHLQEHSGLWLGCEKCRRIA